MMGPRSGPHAGVVVVGMIGVALCCALPALAGLGALTGIGLAWGPLAAVVVAGALGVIVALGRYHGRDGAEGSRRSARRGEV